MLTDSHDPLSPDEPVAGGLLVTGLSSKPAEEDPKRDISLIADEDVEETTVDVGETDPASAFDEAATARKQSER